MNSALSPREIQSMIRSGSTLEQVAAHAGVEESEIEAFAGPVLAEREFIASTAQSAMIRRRGESSSHRRLGDLVRSRLRQRGIDADDLLWDAWRQEDRLWRVVAVLAHEAGDRAAEFIFDARGRFSVADNADARWMIGEESPDASDEDENTIDFNDELALVRATSERTEPVRDEPGDDVPTPSVMQEEFEDTSELDELYDMLSGVSEDSVRIYTGFEESIVVIDNPDVHGTAIVDEVPLVEGDALPVDETAAEPVDVADEEPQDPQDDASHEAAEDAAPDLPESEPEYVDPAAEEAVEDEASKPAEPVQDSLVAEDAVDEEPKPKPKPRKRRQRAQVPSWDEIMFGGPQPKNR